MGGELSRESAIARRVFEEASDALGRDMFDICADPSTLNMTRWSQPAILTMSVAVFRWLDAELGLEPEVAAGHSLGEISALVTAGVLPFSDAVRLVELRGALMQAAVPPGVGLMAAVFGAPRDDVDAALESAKREGHVLAIANDNASSQIVLSGHRHAVQKAGQSLTRAGAVFRELEVSIPSHCPLMAPVAEGLAARLADIRIGAPRFAVLSSVSGREYRGADDVVSTLIAQVTAPVKWRTIVSELAARSLGALLELGPKSVLRDLYKLDHPRAVVFAVDGARAAEPLRRLLAAKTAPIDPTAPIARGREFLSGCLAFAAATPNKSSEEQTFWQVVVPAYDRLVELRASCGEDGSVPLAHLREAAELVRRIGKVKKVNAAELVERLRTMAKHVDANGSLFDAI
jgi:[acyl-carrier-protein] S-malonyltransferase